MTRKELLEKINQQGFDLKPFQFEDMIRTKILVPQHKRKGPGNKHNYTKNDMNRTIQILVAKKYLKQFLNEAQTGNK